MVRRWVNRVRDWWYRLGRELNGCPKCHAVTEGRPGRHAHGLTDYLFVCRQCGAEWAGLR